MNELTTTQNNNLLPDHLQPHTRQQQIERYANSIRDEEDTLYGVGKKLGLNNNQIRFAELFIELYNTTTNPGKEAAAQAYNYNLNTQQGRRQADDIAKRNLTHLDIATLISVLLYNEGFSNEVVDIELANVIRQNYDLNAKMKAIELYAKLHNRIKTITEVRYKPLVDFSTFTPEELEQYITFTERAMIRHEATKHLPLLDENNRRIDE